MATTTARNQQDVDNMSKKDRLWDSMNYTYGLQREASDKSYAQAYSQADRQALSRGMQRSSYNNQTLANINQQKIDAQNQIYNTQIADYENRLQDLENTEWQQAFQEAQFAYQKERDAEADRQWQLAFDAQQAANAASGKSGGSGSGGSSYTGGDTYLPGDTSDEDFNDDLFGNTATWTDWRTDAIKKYLTSSKIQQEVRNPYGSKLAANVLGNNTVSAAQQATKVGYKEGKPGVAAKKPVYSR